MKKTVLLCIATILGFVVWCSGVEEVYRVLTSTEGTEIKAWIRSVENDQVTFRRDDGKIFTIPLSRLSEEDQVELKKMQAEKPATPKTPAAAPDAKVNKRVYPRSISEMKAACTQIRETAKEMKKFSEEEQAAIAELNIYRYLSGVPSEVVLDRKCCEIAVKASEGCAKAGELSHEAAPGGEGKCCNLHSGQSSFAKSVHGYMEDSGANNRDMRGHRRWCLHPDLGKSGFGCDEKKHYFAMWVHNGGMGGSAPKSKSRGRAPEFHAYPGHGYYPVKRLRGNGWSVHPSGGMPQGKPEIHVYELTARPEKPLSAVSMPKDAKEVKIGFEKLNDGSGGWGTGWVVFEPEIKKEAGKIYWVSVKSGAVRIGYVVEFIADDF